MGSPLRFWPYMVMPALEPPPLVDPPVVSPSGVSVVVGDATSASSVPDEPPPASVSAEPDMALSSTVGASAAALSVSRTPLITSCSGENKLRPLYGSKLPHLLSETTTGRAQSAAPPSDASSVERGSPVAEIRGPLCLWLIALWSTC